MGGLTPIAALSSGLQALGTLASQFQARERTKVANKVAEAEARARMIEIRRTQEIEERRHRENLRRALAATRARLGGRGVGSSGGSGAALLQGLIQQSERAGLDERSLDDLRLEEVRRRLAAQRQRNLLESSRAESRAGFGLLQTGVNAVRLLS